MTVFNYGGRGFGRYFDQVELHFFSPLSNEVGGIDIRFDLSAYDFADFFEFISDESHFRDPDLVIGAKKLSSLPNVKCFCLKKEFRLDCLSIAAEAVRLVFQVKPFC